MIYLPSSGVAPTQWDGVINRDRKQAVGLVAAFHPLLGWRDLIGGKNMTPVAGASAYGNNPTIGRSYALDGTDDCAYVTLPEAWKLQRFTVSAWVTLASGGGGTIFSLVPRGAASDGRGMFAAAYTTYTYLVIGAGTGSYTYSNTGQALTAGITYLITQMFDGTNMVVYVNGKQDSTKYAPITISYTDKNTSTGPNPASAYIGGYHSSTNSSPGTTADILYEFNGQIGPVSLYNRALSEAEVWALYDPATRWELYQPARPMIWWVPPATGTTYTQSLAASVEPVTYDLPMGAPATLWPTKRTGRTLAAGLTPTGALTYLKALFRVVSGRMEPTSNLVKRTARTLAAGLTPTGALAALKTFLRTLTASVEPVTYDLPVAEPATLWPTKRTMRTLAAGLTPAASLVNGTLRTLAASLTPAASLVKRTGRTLAAGLTPAASLLKHTLRTLTASLTPSGALSAIRAFLLTLAASLTPAASLVKRTGRTLAASLTPTGALTYLKALFRTLTAGVTPAASLLKHTLRTLAASLTPSGALSAIRAFLLTLAASVAPTGALLKRTGRTLTAALSPIASVIGYLIGTLGGRAKCTLTVLTVNVAEMTLQDANQARLSIVAATTCGLEMSEV
jgi:hypothetical protein